MKIVLVEWAYDADLADEEALLQRYTTTTGWCEALQAQARRTAAIRGTATTSVTGVIRFHRDAVVEHRGEPGPVDQTRRDRRWTQSGGRHRGGRIGAHRTTLALRSPG